MYYGTGSNAALYHESAKRQQNETPFIVCDSAGNQFPVTGRNAADMRADDLAQSTGRGEVWEADENNNRKGEKPIRVRNYRRQIA